MDSLMDFPHNVVVVFVALAVLLVVVSTREYLRLRHLPPGPNGLPFIGSALNMPTKLPWIRFFEISKQYGKIQV